MGFDLHGVAPKINSQEPKILTTLNGWNLPEEKRAEYWEASEKHEAENPGIYFRNNVWWWRPLWTYINNLCGDFLTDKDHEKGGYNDGKVISKTKAVKIAKRILREHKNGNLDKYAQDYKKHLANLPKEKCNICEGTGKRAKAPETGKGNEKCNGCEGTGARESWDKSYPFSVENALDFGKFCDESGGFQIC